MLTSQFQESGLRRLSGVLNTTLDALVVASARAPDVAQTPQIMDQQTLDIFSGKYWTIAVPDDEGGLRPVARSRSLWDSDLEIPSGLFERLEASPGAVITYNDIGPNDEPVRVAATLKEIASRGDRVVYLAAIDRSNIDIDTAQFARLTWTALGLLGVGLIAAVLFQVRIGLRPLYDLQTEIADVRNQARVHLWFEKRFGEPYTALASTDEALTRFVCPAFAIGVRMESDDTISVAAPFGLDDVFGMVLRPNPTRGAARGWDRVVASAKARWPELTVIALETAL